MAKPPVIAIDGPSGVGKGTLSQSLAAQFGWHLLDSGSLYRLTALAAIRHGISLQDSHRLAEVAAHLEVEFIMTNSAKMLILLEGEDVSDSLRSEASGSAASLVAALPAVRQALLERQRAFRRSPGLVADGRDMGTVVFPDAEVKIFLTASAEERAIRRYKQLREKGMDANLKKLAEEIAERDDRDVNRKVSPLRPASDAETLDTTGLSIAEVKARALAIIDKRIYK